MEMSPAAGKILGMLMAYAVSSLGLLLAYVNYRKRIVKADRIFTPKALTVLSGVITAAVGGAVLAAAAASGSGEGLWAVLRTNWFGLVVPAFIVVVSVGLTWMLYRHFARTIPPGNDETEGRNPS